MFLPVGRCFNPFQFCPHPWFAGLKIAHLHEPDAIRRRTLRSPPKRKPGPDVRKVFEQFHRFRTTVITIVTLIRTYFYT